MDQEQLQKAIQLVQSGSKNAALPILTRLVRSDIHDEQAWKWLIQALPAEERPRAAGLFFQQNPGSPLALHIAQSYGVHPAASAAGAAEGVPTSSLKAEPVTGSTPPSSPVDATVPAIELPPPLDAAPPGLVARPEALYTSITPQGASPASNQPEEPFDADDTGQAFVPDKSDSSTLSDAWILADTSDSSAVEPTLPTIIPHARPWKLPLWLAPVGILVFLAGCGLSLWAVLSLGGAFKPHATPTAVPVVALAPTEAAPTAGVPPASTPQASTPSAAAVSTAEPSITAVQPSLTPAAATNDLSATPLPSATLAVSLTPEASSTPAATTPASLQAGDTRTSQMDHALQVYVPAGTFSMGSEQGDASEKPVHSVTLDAFWIDQSEVTNAQYAQCVQAGGCTPPSKTTIYRNLEYFANRAFSNFPVVYIHWDQASAYCGWAKRRLPTEAEWEKAARGSDSRIYPWGSQAPNKQIANFGYLYSQPIQVNSLPAGDSPYHAADMAGNVYEWVSDWYNVNYYAISPAENPLGPDSGLSRVFRGGSFANIAAELRVTRRQRAAGSYASETVGFRCAVTAQ